MNPASTIRSVGFIAAAGWLLLACSSVPTSSTAPDEGPAAEDGGTPADGTPADGGTPSEDGGPPVDPDPCGLSSGYPGDEYCILPPAKGEGVQFHVGPPSYEAADVEPFLLQPGEENVKCYLARIPETGFYFLHQKNRLRSGSHHMLIGTVPDEGQAEGETNCGFLGLNGFLPPSQGPVRDIPDNLGPEDAGLARYLRPGTMAWLQMHYVNPGREPVLREAWVNLYRLDESEVSQRLQPIFMVADRAIEIPPRSRVQTTLSFEPQLTAPTRIFSLNAHMHAHAESFTVWRVRGEQRDLVYKSFDWSEPIDLTYNSVTDNPRPDDGLMSDGGSSGQFMMEPGDRLEWTCDVNNTTDQPLRFANEAYTAEMCLLNGEYVSETPGLFFGICSDGACITLPGATGGN